jgi:phage terminase large subunit
MPALNVPVNYTPRDYQLPVLTALDDGFKRIVWVAHRRSGKDKTCVNIVAKKMFERVGAYYYLFPTYNQGRKILWDGIDREGKRFLDHFPKEFVVGKPNDTQMKLEVMNGSLFQIVGSDNIDSIVGTNPVGVVLTEYSLQDPQAWGYLRPILAENGGWAIFVYTPRGENHGYDLYELAKNDPSWYCRMDRASETKVIPQAILDQERAEIIRLYGNDALYQQEYECNFTVPIAGAYYAELIMRAYRDGRVGKVPHEPSITVDTWWDLGINDRMSVWFSQSIGTELRLIDYYENTGHGLPHYIGKLQEKGYVYGKHTAPHDIEVRELSNGKSRRDTAANLGISFGVAPKLLVVDGIDAVRNLFSKCWFDAEKCKDGLNALKNYRKQYDEKRKTYLNQPYHDWSSNGADAFRTLATGLDMRHRGVPSNPPDKYARSAEKKQGGSAIGILG